MGCRYGGGGGEGVGGGGGGGGGPGAGADQQAGEGAMERVAAPRSKDDPAIPGQLRRLHKGLRNQRHITLISTHYRYRA